MKRVAVVRHGKAKHGQAGKALKEGEAPSCPKYMNWKEWVEDPANTTPFKLPEEFKKPFNPNCNFVKPATAVSAISDPTSRR